MAKKSQFQTDDALVDIIYAAVEGWCDSHSEPTRSPIGRAALHQAIRLALDGFLTVEDIDPRLTAYMIRNQYAS